MVIEVTQPRESGTEADDLAKEVSPPLKDVVCSKAYLYLSFGDGFRCFYDCNVF